MRAAADKGKNVSITVLLATAVGGLVALSVSVVLGLSFYANFVNTTELLENSSSQLIRRIEQYIVSQVNPARYVVENFTRQASAGSFDPGDKSELALTLQASLAAAPELTGIAFWQPDGRKLQVRRHPPNGRAVLSATKINGEQLKSFLETSQNSRAPVWSKPLRFDGLSFVSVTAPVFRNEKYIGTVTAGISIANLSEAIEEVVEGTAFTGFILYDDKYVLAHKTLPQLSTANLSRNKPLHLASDINDPVLADFSAGKPGTILNSKNFEVRSLKLGGKRYVILSHLVTLPGLKNWRVGVHAPRRAVSTQIRRGVASLVAGVILLLGSILAAVYLARMVARPIKKVSLAATRIGKFDLADIEKLPGSCISEIDNQSQAFNQMLDGLKWFESYVPKKLVSSLIKQGEGAVESRLEDLTVMFTDLIGFTKNSENLAPAETASMLNRHFELLNRCIEKTDGTLDKYIGDAVMAFWGAPEPQSDHARRACETALAISEQLEKDKSGLRMKIALHCGPLIVGNIGASARMNYTVIGDTVNTCSRIEKLAGDLDDGSRVIILVSEQVADAVKGHFALGHAGEFSVKGRDKTVKVFRLKGRL